jgi:exonuclease SbcD
VGFCFVHAADLHLDTPYEGVSLESSSIGDALREASLGAFDDVVQLTLDRGAAFLLIAGDVYDGAERGVRAQLRFLAGLRRLSDAGVPVFVVHGNHDPVGGWSGVREWPPGVHVFRADDVETVSVERDGSVIARIQGVSYGRRDVTDDLSALYRRDGGPGLQIGLLHCNVGGDPAHAPYSPCALDDLVAAGFDYWALGHIHQRQVLHEAPSWVVYPGSTQGRSLKPSERGAKGVCVVHVEGGSVRRVEPVAVDRVRFEAIEVDIGEVADIGALRARLVALVDTLRASAAPRGVVVRALLRGRGPVHSDLTCAGGVAGLLDDLRGECGSERPFLWWESVRDLTRPVLDLEAIRGRNDFSAALLEKSEALLGGGLGEAGPFVERIMSQGPAKKAAAAAGADATEDAAAVLDEALVMALDLIEEETSACT